ncbi:MAG TPA: tetratricopeptide repeat protein, partial [Planctomycetaceae bacterium]
MSRKRSQPFFCWAHLYDPHAPYSAHADMFGDAFADPYDAEIAYVDMQIGRLVDFLRKQGLESQTLVVVVGDHGEGLSEHVERAHGITLYNSTMHVPLIFRQSGRLPPGRLVPANLSLVDVAPTILSLAGVTDAQTAGVSFEAALLGGDAPSLLRCYGLTDEPFLVNGWAPLQCLTEGHWKYIRTTRVELYDLAADPHERHNLADARPDKLREMEVRLADVESRMVRRDEVSSQLTPTEIRKLEALGYLGAGGPARTGPVPAHLPDVKDMLPFDNEVQDAVNLAHEGALDQAIERLQTVIRKAPSCVQAYQLLGDMLRVKSDFDEASNVFRSLLEIRPEARNAHFGLGNVFLAQGRIDEAKIEFLKELEINPELAEAHYNLAAICANTGQADEALAHFDAALEINSRYVAAYLARADLLARLGRMPEAIGDWKDALKCDPNASQTHQRLGVVLANRGDAQEALRHLSRAVELNPRNA